MFKKNKKHPILYSIILGTAIIMFWRGIWGLLDLYLFPNNEVMSYGISIVIGLLLLFLNGFNLEEIE